MSEQKSDYDEKFEKDLAEIHTLLEKRKKRKAIDVYVVLVLNAFNNAKVSQEAYTSLAAAQEFCKGRADKPEQLTRYCFKSKVYTYQIYWTTLVLDVQCS